MKPTLRKNIRALVSIVTVAILVTTLVLSYYASKLNAFSVTENQILRQSLNRMNFIQGTAEQFLELNLHTRLRQIVSSVAAEPDLLHFFISDPNGRIIVSSSTTQLGKHWRDTDYSLDESAINEVIERKVVRSFVNDEKRFVDSYISVCGTATQFSLRDTHCGFASYRVDLAYHHRITLTSLQQETAFLSAALSSQLSQYF